MLIKRTLIVCLLFLTVAGPAAAFKLEKIDWFSDFHLGLVAGIGTGLNFGATALFSPGDLKIGAEIDQLITDVNYSATVNCTRIGAVLAYVFSDSCTVNGHFGGFQFKSNKDINFNDLSGKSCLISENVNTRGQYWAISFDYLIKDWNLILIPRYEIDVINDQGSLQQINLSVGKSI